MTIGKYNVIYADPPWRYAQKGLQGAAERHYPTMGIEELCALPVADLAAPDSVLFLWATFPQLPEALRLIKAWGFQYKSVGFVWLKKNKKADACYVTPPPVPLPPSSVLTRHLEKAKMPTKGRHFREKSAKNRGRFALAKRPLFV